MTVKIATALTITRSNQGELELGPVAIVFEWPFTTAQVYDRLRSGKCIEIERLEQYPLQHEKQGLLMAEKPLLIEQIGDTGWRLSMP